MGSYLWWMTYQEEYGFLASCVVDVCFGSAYKKECVIWPIGCKCFVFGTVERNIVFVWSFLLGTIKYSGSFHVNPLVLGFFN